MSFALPPIGGVDPLAPRLRAAAPRPAQAPAPVARAAEDSVSLSLTDAPPPDLLREVEAAGRRVDELRAQDRELRFERNAQTGRIRIEVRDTEGELLRTIPPGEAVDVAAGKSLD